MATLNELLADPKRQIVIKQRQVAMAFGIQIESALAKAKLKRSDFAQRLGKSRAWVSKLLYGPRNMKLFTAVEVADALDCDVELRLVPRQVELQMHGKPGNFEPQVQTGNLIIAKFGNSPAPAEANVTAHGNVTAGTPIAV